MEHQQAFTKCYKLFALNRAFRIFFEATKSIRSGEIKYIAMRDSATIGQAEVAAGRMIK